MVRFLMALFVAVVASVPAWAGSSVSIGVWSGSGDRPHGPHWRPHRPGFHGHPWGGWGYPYYRPRTVFLYSAPVYAPPPVAYPVYPAPTITPSATGQCRQFNGDATIDGSGTPFYGRACIFTDGRWHIVP